MIFFEDIKHWLFPKKMKPAGTIKTPAQIDRELEKLMKPKILRKLKQDPSARADLMLFKMLDARNLTLVGLTLNWVMGRFEKPPVDFVIEMIADRKHRTSKDSTQALFEQWLKLHAIDKNYLMALIGEVAPYEILKNNKSSKTSMTDEMRKDGEPETPETPPADVPATPAEPETPPADAGANAPAQ